LRENSAEGVIAMITEDRNLVGGGAPIFYVSSLAEKERVAQYLSRITRGMVHDLGNGVYIIVRH